MQEQAWNQGKSDRKRSSPLVFKLGTGGIGMSGLASGFVRKIIWSACATVLDNAEPCCSYFFLRRTSAAICLATVSHDTSQDSAGYIQPRRALRRQTQMALTMIEAGVSTTSRNLMCQRHGVVKPAISQASVHSAFLGEIAAASFSSPQT